MKIFLISSERIIIQTLEEFLTDLKHEVVTLNSISELLNRLKIKQELEGLVIIEEGILRSREKEIIKGIHNRYSNILFIVITSSAPNFSTKEAISHGIYGYLHKPISLVELDLLLTWLDKKVLNLSQLL